MASKRITKKKMIEKATETVAKTEEAAKTVAEKTEAAVKAAGENIEEHMNKLEKELQNVQRFMQTTRLHDQPIIEIYEEDKRRQAAAHRDDWKESMYNDR